jgi:hypothetical protein
MPKELTIGNETFEFPLSGENAGWGENVTDWATAVTSALSTVQQPNDITRTTAQILNNRSTDTSVTAFLFDSSEVVSVNGEYVVTRTTTSPAQTFVQSGFIQGNYDGTNWNIIHKSVGDAGVTLDITSSGQVTYTSTNITGSAYTGVILFRAKVFNEDE